MSRFAKSLLLTAGLVGLLSVALPAQAQEPEQEYAPTMLVLDASGSMNAADPGGGSKMDAAKTAVRNFVGTAPAESKVGLTVYGTGTGSSDAEQAAGCQDVRVLREAQTIDKGVLTSAVDGIVASGYTPIGTSLRTAAAALPQSGPRSIVLVSDGEDTCAPPDPCEVARELNQQGAKVVVHAIGFGVDAASRAQLTCVAQTTGGTYTDAVDGASLQRVLPRVSQAALRTYKPIGTAITGTATHRDAPVATAGQYLDTIGQKEKRYYALDVPEGATAYFSGTLSFPRIPHDAPNGDTSSLAVRVFGADGKDCNEFEFESVVNSSHGVALTVSTPWDGATKPKTGGSSDHCRGGGRYYFATEWSGIADNMPERMPIELLFGIEPGVTDAGPAAATAKTTFVEPTGDAVSAVGGGSFNVAGALSGSGSYTDTIQRGEFVFYRVRLDWGQGLAYRVNYEATSTHGRDGLSNITTTLYSPFRDEIQHAFSSYGGDARVLPTSDPALATLPVRYNNRTSEELADHNQSVAGWYYIAVKVGPAETTDAVPIRMDVTVAGDAEPGPRYEEISTGGVSGENATPKTSETSAAAEENSDGISTTGMVTIVASGVVVVGMIVSGLLLWRRRTTASRR
ncbi:VWA domain-containing protein [Nocardia uniformis]|uniref:VWA domain-containing protein n=1 Tax=Nocardia uniformis TaxID=53432 RepID=A0A849C400_9NOCA|nr:VWA domain-containing protein [Nocardia uniformis]NNH73433.1 VWA domain-containing protein [Nocardia uniformis]